VGCVARVRTPNRYWPISPRSGLVEILSGLFLLNYGPAAMRQSGLDDRFLVSNHSQAASASLYDHVGGVLDARMALTSSMPSLIGP